MSVRASRNKAPAVQFPVGRSPWLATVLAMGSAVGLLALLAWMRWGASAHPVWIMGVALLLWLGSSGAAWRFWSCLPVGVLLWDGAGWSLQQGRKSLQSSPLTVQLDLQRRICVCLRPATGPRCWIWLEQRSAPGQWSSLRRAVYSRAGAELVDAALPATSQGHDR